MKAIVFLQELVIFRVFVKSAVAAAWRRMSALEFSPHQIFVFRVDQNIELILTRLQDPFFASPVDDARGYDLALEFGDVEVCKAKHVKHVVHKQVLVAVIERCRRSP